MAEYRVFVADGNKHNVWTSASFPWPLRTYTWIGAWWVARRMQKRFDRVMIERVHGHFAYHDGNAEDYGIGFVVPSVMVESGGANNPPDVWREKTCRDCANTERRGHAIWCPQRIQVDIAHLQAVVTNKDVVESPEEIARFRDRAVKMGTWNIVRLLDSHEALRRKCAAVSPCRNNVSP